MAKTKKVQHVSPEGPIKSVNTINNAADNGAKLHCEFARWLLTSIFSVAVCIMVAAAIQKNYHPDISPLLAMAKNILAEAGSVRPEPVETLLFRVSLVVIFFSLFLFYWLFLKMASPSKLASKPLFTYFASACISLLPVLIYADFTAANPFGKAAGDVIQNARDLVGDNNFDFYFKGVFLGDFLLPYTFIITPIIALFFLGGIKSKNWDNNLKFQTWIWRAGYLVSGFLLLVILAMNTFYSPYTFENKIDFGAVYSPMTQVYAGVPMLVNGFMDFYGLYPHFLNPLFQIVGLSILKFSLVMSSLVVASLVFNFYVLKRFVRNSIILFLGFVAVIDFPYLSGKFISNFDPYFAIMPIRYIVPSVLCVLATMYLMPVKTGAGDPESKWRMLLRSKQVLYWLTLVVMALAILWNPEFGLVSYASWLIVLSYNDFYDIEGKVRIRRVIFHWIAGITVAIVAIFAYKLTILAVYGAVPDMAQLFQTIFLFGKIGFNLLPMPLVHPWNLAAVIIILGFLYAISKFIKKQVTPRSSIVLLLSLISVGFLVYYQGRSHNWSFSGTAGFCLILLTVLGDELWATVKESSYLPMSILFVVFLFVISFSFFNVIYNAGKFNELIFQEDDKEKATDEQKLIENNKEFIEKNTQPKEKIFVFTGMQLQALYFDGSKRISAINPALFDLIPRSAVERIKSALADSSFKVFLEPAFCSYPYMREPIATMAATYELKDSNHTMMQLVKQKEIIPSISVLQRGDNSLLHRKYYEDTAGMRARVNDAAGTGRAVLPPAFSAEVVFQPHAQIYPYGTLLGNMNDTSGFIICNILNTDLYFFGVNGHGMTVPVPRGGWAYLAMNVFPDHAEVYRNGELAATLPLPKPMAQSPEKIGVGNCGYFRYYAGAISEVAVNKTTLDKGQIMATWEALKGAAK